MSSSSITNLIAQQAAANGVPPALAIAQAQQESSLNPNAYNPTSGATGLFQLEPATATMLGVTNPLDPTQSAQAGTAYLAQLFNRFGDWATALAAYDWGPTNVAKYGVAAAPAETQNYVSTILGNAGMSTTQAVSTDAYDSILLPSDDDSPNALVLIAGAIGVYFIARLLFD